MQIEDSILIESRAEVVWNVTYDVERWPEWTPTVDAVKKRSESPLRVGDQCLLKQPGLPEATWTITEIVEGQRFAWESRIRGIKFSAVHEIETLDEQTRNRLILNVEGIVAALFWPILKPQLRNSLRQENAGLKQRCEEYSTGQ